MSVSIYNKTTGQLDPIAGIPFGALEAKQPKDLSSAITIGGQSKTTVEAALVALNSAKSDKGVIPVNPVSTTGLNIWLVDEE